MNFQIAKKRATKYYTYGFQRAEVLGAFTNGILLCGLCISIIVNAIQNFISPNRIEQTKIILVLGIIGFIANIGFYYLLHPLTRIKKRHNECQRKRSMRIQMSTHYSRNHKLDGKSGEKRSTHVSTTNDCSSETSDFLQKNLLASKPISYKSLNLIAICFHLVSDAFSSLLLIITAALIALFRSDWSIFFGYFPIQELHDNWFLAAWHTICNLSEAAQIGERLSHLPQTQQCNSFCHIVPHWTDYIDATLSLVLAGFICYGCVKHGMFSLASS